MKRACLRFRSKAYFEFLAAARAAREVNELGGVFPPFAMAAAF
jgi:hypothetical protein